MYKVRLHYMIRIGHTVSLATVIMHHNGCDAVTASPLLQVTAKLISSLLVLRAGNFPRPPQMVARCMRSEKKKISVWMKLVPSGLRAEYPFESLETKRVRVTGLNARLTKVTTKNACFRQIFCQDGRRNVPAWLLQHHFNIIHTFKRAPGSP